MGLEAGLQPQLSLPDTPLCCLRLRSESSDKHNICREHLAYAPSASLHTLQMDNHSKEIWIRAMLSPAHSDGKVQEDIKEADIWESLDHEGLLLSSKH